MGKISLIIVMVLGLSILSGCKQQIITPQDYEEYQVLGNPDAPVTFIEYSDYQCPFCKKFFLETFPAIKETYVDTGKVKFVFKDFPLEIHKGAKSAAVAAHCAGEQGKYYEYHDILFVNSRNHSDENFILWAKELGLASELFSKCLADPAQLTKVEKSIEAAKSAGVKGTPTLFVNSHLVAGPQPFAAFKQLIEAELKGEFIIEQSLNATCNSDANCDEPRTFPPYCSGSNKEKCTTTMTPTCKLPGTKESSCVAIIVENCDPCPGICDEGECKE